MTEKRIVRLVGPLQRRTAHQYIDDAPDGYVVRISPPAKKREQEEKYHAMVGDIAKQTQYAGRSWNAIDMKRIMIDEFAEAMRLAQTPLHHDSRIIPSEDGKRIIQLEIHSSEFYVKEASNFIEWLYFWGAEHSVIWSDEARK